MSVFSRAKNLGRRVIQESKEFPGRLLEYGPKVACATYVDGLIPPEKHAFYISTIESYVDRFMIPIVESYQNWSFEQMPERPAGPVPVWCCWWQGEDQMPELVKMCNDRLRRLLPEDQAELRMITQENYKTYVELPDYIIEKFEQGKMSITALSDILRVALLAEYGGFWIDATVFISDYFPTEFITRDYYAQRMYDPIKWKREACKGRWCGFLMGGRAGNIIFLLLRDAFFAWWKEHNSVIDYVILDYFLLSGYKTIPAIQSQVDNLPDNNPDVFEMYKVLNEPFSDKLYQNLTKHTNLHKLTYKMELTKASRDGQPTLYSYLLALVPENVALSQTQE